MTAASAIEWLCEEREDGQLISRIGRCGSEWIVELVNVCTLRSNGTKASFEAAKGADPALVEKFRRGAGRALLRHLDSHLSLHGSAVSQDERAIVFVARSGGGKSTVAAELCRRHGFALLADDAACIQFDAGTPVVTPSEETHWLLPDSRAAIGVNATRDGKRPIEAERVARSAARIVAICRLVFDDSAKHPSLHRVRGFEAVRLVASHAIRFAIDDAKAHANELENISMLVGSVPVFDLTRPRDLVRLRSCGEVVATLIRGGSDATRS